MELADVRTVTVLGAGSMGHGIAEVAALAGYNVYIRDISGEFIEQGYNQIEWSVKKLAEKGHLDEEPSDILNRVTTFIDLDAALNGADIVIEAVPEKMDLKKEVYEEIAQRGPEDAIFATNTSTFSITELSEATDRPERFCGMHFFNPPVQMPLVEVIAGAHTDEGTLEFAEALASSMDKTPVRVRKDSPGFIVNRVLVPMLNEAGWLVYEGEATVAEVDSSSKYGLGLPMGCFELADQIGIDVIVDVVEYMHETLGNAYEPCPLFQEKVDAGEVGKKTDVGFYNWASNGADIQTDTQREEIKERLIAIAVNEVAKLVAADVADSAEIDEAVKLGAGFPEGPTQLVSNIGYERIHNVLREHHNETGESRYEPAGRLMTWSKSDGPGSQADGARTFDSICVEYPEEGIAHVFLDRPHRMNTISEKMLDELSQAFDDLEDDDEVLAVALTGEGDRAFSAGADVQGMAAGVSPFDAVDFSRHGQRTFGKLEQLSKPVVVGVDGFCLGGGMELATCADLCVATDKSKFGQPEHDLGLIPGWGGTQRLKYIVGERRAREIIIYCRPIRRNDHGGLRLCERSRQRRRRAGS